MSGRPTARREMLVVYEQQIRMARRHRSLCTQARIVRKISDPVDTIGVIPPKAKRKRHDGKAAVDDADVIGNTVGIQGQTSTYGREGFRE